MQPIRLVEPVVMLATVAQWLVLATVTGTLVGAGTSLFLYALFYVTPAPSMPVWGYMLLLPLGGLFNGLLLHWGYRANKTGLKDSTISAVQQQAGRMPLATAWIKPVAALATLACGGSVGRTGPCSHIGGAIAAGIGEVLHLNSALRKRLVACGISAGFAGVFGTPIAGAVYGVEILTVGYIRHDFLFPATVAGFASFEVSKLFHAPYIEYFAIGLPNNFSEILFIKTVFLGIICGLIAWLYVLLIDFARQAFKRFRYRFDLWPPLMPLIGGVILSGLIIVIPTDYLGLSLPLMRQALAGDPMPYLGFLWKSILVAITLGSGFYGGVVTPQLVIGAMSGSAFSHLFGISPAFGGAIGLVAVVAAASDAPIAAILMGVELFSESTGSLYAAGACIAAYLVIGHRSVYPDQLVAFTKTSWIAARPGLPLDMETFHLSYGLRRRINHLRKWGRRQRP